MTQKLSASSQATNAAAETKAQASALSAQAQQSAADSKAVLTEEQRKRLAEEQAKQKAAAEQAMATEQAAGAETTAKTVPATEAQAPASADPLADTIAKAEAGAATPASAPAASGGFSPWLIGAGVLGAVGVAVAAGGSDDDNSSNNNTLAQTPGNDQNANNAAANGAGSGAGAGAGAGAGTGAGNNAGGATPGTAGAGNDAGAGNNGNAPAAPATPDPTKQTVTVTADNADVRLAADLFDDSAANTQFIRITNIDSSHGTDFDARVYRDYKVSENGQEVDRHTAYEVIQAPEGVTWQEASQRAAALGGKLLVINDQAEADFIRDQLSSRLGDTPENFGHLSRGSWIGLQQAADQANPETGWTWTDGRTFSAQDWATFGANIGGADNIPTDGEAGSATEANKANHAAIIEGWNTATNSLSSNMIYDYGGKLASFVVEYEHVEAARPLILETANGRVGVEEGQVIGSEDFGKLLWNSVFSAQGKIEYEAVNGWDNPQTLPGAKPVTLTLNEAPAAAPAAPATPSSASAMSALLGEEQQTLI
ncbi:MAG: C-type lectin domain-containing protein [Lautropia sp.]|nr:C-type lectin domain-containing protein [Lautropia sp.]